MEKEPEKIQDSFDEDMDLHTIQRILNEVSAYQIELVADPTLPEYGNKYVMEKMSQCRFMMNRVHYYMQSVKVYLRDLKSKERISSLDFDFKMRDKMANDPTVRSGSSSADRHAIATFQLKYEYEELSKLKTKINDISESFDILKDRYENLKSTMQDIRTQKSVVKDEKDIGGIGGRPVPTQGVYYDPGVPPVVSSIDMNAILDDKEKSGGNPDDDSEKPSEAALKNWLNS